MRTHTQSQSKQQQQLRLNDERSPRAETIRRRDPGSIPPPTERTTTNTHHHCQAQRRTELQAAKFHRSRGSHSCSSQRGQGSRGTAPADDQAEAEKLAAAEGLVLVPSSRSCTSYRGVYPSDCIARPFTARFDHPNERPTYLGNYTSKYEAALAIAKYHEKVL